MLQCNVGVSFRKQREPKLQIVIEPLLPDGTMIEVVKFSLDGKSVGGVQPISTLRPSKSQ